MTWDAHSPVPDVCKAAITVQRAQQGNTTTIVGTIDIVDGQFWSGKMAPRHISRTQEPSSGSNDGKDPFSHEGQYEYWLGWKLASPSLLPCFHGLRDFWRHHELV